MFLLALVYLIILIIWAVFSWAPDRWGRYGSIAELVLFAIIGFALFWNVLNK